MRQTAAFGLQKVCNVSSGQYKYQWRDNCKESSVYKESDFAYIVANTSDNIYPSWRFPKVPIGSAQSACDNAVFFYTTCRAWGPWDDWTCCDTFIAPHNSYVGIICRKGDNKGMVNPEITIHYFLDLNPCGSNPCLATEDCVANKSCFYCTPKIPTTSNQILLLSYKRLIHVILFLPFSEQQTVRISVKRLKRFKFQRPLQHLRLRLVAQLWLPLQL